MTASLKMLYWGSILSATVLAGCSRQPPQIIHVVDWHYVSREDFAADLKCQSAEISDQEIDKRYAAFLDDVETVQTEQMMLLRGLIREHGIKRIFVEGVTEENVEAFRTAVEELPELDLPELQRQMLEEVDFSEQALLLVTIEEHRAKLLQIGAVGHLMMTDEAEVVPLEDQRLWAGADPIKRDCEFDGEANDEREWDMARRLAAERSVAIAVLGGGHNLQERFSALNSEIKYRRIEPEAYRQSAVR